MQNIFKVSKGGKERAVAIVMAISLFLQGGIPIVAYATYTEIVAHKIVCDSESDLPNWGNGTTDITANTVTNFLATHPHCHPQSGWKFQYAPSNTANPGDNSGLAASPWLTSDATNASGKTSWYALVPNFGDRIWVREVADPAYIPFTGVGTAPSVSAEIYCHKDGLNYDNYDYVLNPQVDSTYYCVAFNVLKTPTHPQNEKPVITVVGQNPAEVVIGTPYVDQGATVADPEDGQIDNKLVTTGTVNVNTLGAYTITYNATDSQSLAADTKTRTVNVVPPPVCLAPVDVMLVLDRSGSMNDDGTNPEQPLTQAKAGASGFIDRLTVATDKAGVVTFGSSATLNSALSTNFTAVKASYASVTASGSTNIGAAIEKASTEMAANGRTGTKHVMVLLSDGLPNVSGMTVAQASQAALAKATAAKSAGTVIYTIGLGTDVNPTLMKSIASSPLNYYFAPSGADLENIYNTIAITECKRDPATVSGKKINDENNNGSVESGEVGIADWQITLTEVAGNGLVLSASTTNDGSYTFSDVVPGNYMLCEVNQAGWTQTSPNTTVNNGCYFLNLDPGATLAHKDFLNTESDKPQCRDGKDNDGDGKIDFAGTDGGCDNPDDNDENQKPVITVVGTNPVTVTQGDAYVDQSATVADPEDGDITAKLVTLGTVDTNVIANYTITYNATDSKNVAADTKTRTVKVVAACSDGKDNDGDTKIDFAGGDTGCDTPNDNDENNPPVITVLGANPFNITQGNTFTDPGATALDPEDGDRTANIVTTGTVDTSIVGAYTIHYNVVDTKGLAAAEKTRVVNVTPPLTECNDGVTNDADAEVDFGADAGCDTPEDNDENEKPVITVLGDNPLEIHLGTAFVDPSATVADHEEGDITANLVVTGTVDTNTLGSYTLTYDAQDSEGLAADQKTRVVKVITSCSDAKDNDGDQLADFPLDPGCDTPEDDTENSKPVITLLGDVLMSLTVGTTYTEPSATVNDQEDGDITGKLVVTGSVDTNTVGAYVIDYNATDSQSLAADQVSRTVNVTPAACTVNCGGGSTPPACSDGGDNDGDSLADFPRDPGCDSPQDNDERDTGPVLTLLGDNPMSVTVNTTFTDPGATATDPEEGNITSKIVVTGSVNVGSVGTYTITYNVSDTQGHAATPVSRTVNVVPGVGCTANCGGGGGSTPLAITNEKLTSTGTTTVVITWDTNLPATSRVVYGLNPVTSLGSLPLYGYDLTTATDTTLTTTHSVTIDGIPSAVSTYFRPLSTTNTESAVGIELTHGAVLGETTECFYLREYMRIGANNNPVEVTKLQNFLRNYEGFTTLEVNGFFDTTTDAAVRAFQDKYKADVLTPWNLPGNTGYVYYTTQKKINEIYCKREFPLNKVQIEEVASFRELINKIGAQGSAQPELSLVGMNTNGGSIVTTTTGEGSGSETTVTAGTIGEEVEDSSTKRGRVALSDLLATSPNMGSELSGTETDKSILEQGVVAGASTKRGLAAVMESVSDRLHLSNSSYAVVVLLVLIMLLAVIYLRRRSKQDEME